jgi:hypothetical protein
MTIGIYALVFENTDMVYIGQSDNIERRYSEHLQKLNNGKGSKKLQNAFNSFGTPKFHVLKSCSIDVLDTLEIEYISEFNSYDEGFNSTLGGHVWYLRGDSNTNSKYLCSSIEEVFEFIGDNPQVPLTDIAKKYGVGYGTLMDIVKGRGHVWLKEVNPDMYTLMISSRKNSTNHIGKNNKTSSDRGLIYPPIISPEGIEYDISNVSGFSKEHNLNYGTLHSLLNRKRRTHKGWMLKENISLTSPQ